MDAGRPELFLKLNVLTPGNASIQDYQKDAVKVATVWAYLAAAALSIFAVSCFVRWPIVAGDTDLWYHLNGGRYIATRYERSCARA